MLPRSVGMVRQACVAEGCRRFLPKSRPSFSSTSSEDSSFSSPIVQMAQDLMNGNRRALGKGLTLIESTHPMHLKQSALLLQCILQSRKHKAHSLGTAQTYRVGISGPPGAGKSTLIDQLGCHLSKLGKKVAVMAVDPSSAITGGSILGDKTRMENLAREPAAFVRPSPSKGFLGGVTANSYESILLLEAGGYDVILIETVGVGQSEISVAELTDVFLLLIPPTAGDELQGIKRGIMEVADIICVTKCDGDTVDAAKRTWTQYSAAVRVLDHSPTWAKRVLTCSVNEPPTIAELWEQLMHYKRVHLEANLFFQKREKQREQQLWNQLNAEIAYRIRTMPMLEQDVQKLERDVITGQVTPRQACYSILDKIFPTLRHQ